MSRFPLVVVLCVVPSLALADIRLGEFSLFDLRAQSSVDELLQDYTKRFSKIESITISGANAFGANRNLSLQTPEPEEVKTLMRLVPILRSARFVFASEDRRKCTVNMQQSSPFEITCQGTIAGSSTELVMGTFVEKFGEPNKKSKNHARWDCQQQLAQDRPGRGRPLCWFRVNVTERKKTVGVDVMYTATLKINRTSDFHQIYNEKVKKAKQRGESREPVRGATPKL